MEFEPNLKGYQKSACYKRLIGLLLIINFNNAFAASPPSIPQTQQYVGLDYLQRTINMVDGFGKGLFSKRLPQGNLYFGKKIYDYLILEAGLIFSQSSTRTAFSRSGSLVLGRPIFEGEFILSENKINMNGIHLNMVSHFPITSSDFYCIGSIGIAVLKLNAKFKPILEEDLDPSNSLIERRLRRFSSKKLISRFLAGMGYHFSETLEFRALIGYETTSRFKNLVPKEQSAFRLSLKNNLLFSLGLATNF